MTNFDVYFLRTSNGRTLIDTNYKARCLVNSKSPDVSVEQNSEFHDDMKIHFSPKLGSDLYLTSLTTNTRYPIFRGEFAKVLENCNISKSEVLGYKWTIRKHGGLFSIKLVI